MSPPKSATKYASLPSLSTEDELEWLEKVSDLRGNGEDINITWPAHHAEKKRGPPFFDWTDVAIATFT